MRIPTSETNDTLDAASLPPTDGTELNYRTRPDVDTEIRFTRDALALAVGVSVVTAIAVRFLVPDYLGYAAVALFGTVWWVVPDAARPDPDAPSRTGEFRLWLVAVLVGCVALHAAIPPYLAGYLVAFPCAVAALAGLALVYARQVVAWMAANPKVYGDVGREWQGYFPHPGRWAVCEQLPAARATVLAPVFLLAAYLFGVLVLFQLGFESHNPLAPPLAVAGFILFLGLVVLVRRVFNRDEGFSLGLTARVLWELLVVFASYNRHRTPAAGVFRFPLRPLVDVDARKHFLLVILLAAGLATAVVLPPVWPPAVTARPVQGQLLPHERDYLSQLPPGEARREAAALVRSRTVTEDDIERMEQERWESIPRRVITVLVAVPLGVVLVTAVVVWAAVGELLAGFYLALEAPGGRARTTDSEWDVYVSRLVNSQHALEREHLLVGFSVFGDYPVLLHKAILDQHYHLTGDTGSMKTSLVVGPLATQLMARNDCSVVVLDLKGDMALFESCRVEAAKAGLPFSWFTSERGRSSHAFNPFVQSYHRDVTTDQRAETLIQGLSLDYGMGYGRAYFTAINEKVLKSILRKMDLKSFVELDALLNGPHALDFLTAKDVRDAGHLTAIVNRLAAVAPLNEVRPEGSPRRIEVADILNTKQVVYLNLKSAQEPLAAASIARLFLWSLFSCAAHSPARDNRVYLVIDEFQQIIADAIKLVFEQIRGLGVTLVPVHQTGGQLLRQGTDLADTVDSCTAVKHVLRASDPRTVKRIAEMSGVQKYHTFTWTQDMTDGDGELDPSQAVEGLLQVSETYGEALDRNTIMAASADQQASFIRFTFGSGYTQFGAKTTIVRSLFPVDRDTHARRERAPWPILPDESATASLPAKPTDPKPLPPAPPDGKGTDWDERFRNDNL
jgi:hypothetical protein